PSFDLLGPDRAAFISRDPLESRHRAGYAIGLILRRKLKLRPSTGCSFQTKLLLPDKERSFAPAPLIPLKTKHQEW
ncbi:unnamed protein product, partial [Mycena citricolor]